MKPESLGALDSVFVTMDAPNTPLHVGALIELEAPAGAVVDPEQRFAKIRERIEERLSSIAVLRRRVVRAPFDLGQPVLVDDPDFDLDFHIVRRAVPAPGGPAEVDSLVARVMAHPLAPDRPLWELSVIEGLAGGRTALLVKIHHALTDGVSGVMVFAGLFDLEPDGQARPESEISEDGPVPPVPTPLEMLGRSSSELLRRPGAVLEALGTSLTRLATKVDELVAGHEEHVSLGHDANLLEAPSTSLSGTISHARRFGRLELSLSQVKSAARRHGGTVTDFAMSVTGGAVQRLLEERGEAPTKDLVAFVPVNIRAPGTEGDLGNRITARLVPMDTTVEDSFERMGKVVARSKAVKAAPVPTTDLVNDLAEAAGPALSSLAGRVVSAFELFDLLPQGANCVVSSVPGPPVPLWCAGEQIVRVAPMGPLMFNQGINVTLLSYCDTIEFGILMCAKRVPDADRFVALLADEAQALLVEPLISQDSAVSSA